MGSAKMLILAFRRIQLKAWPFCAAKCPYCDFNSHVVPKVDQDRWKLAYLSEIKRLSRETNGQTLNSIYFGGGTPSLMNPDLVAEVLQATRDTRETESLMRQKIP